MDTVLANKVAKGLCSIDDEIVFLLEDIQDTKEMEPVLLSSYCTRLAELETARKVVVKFALRHNIDIK